MEAIDDYQVFKRMMQQELKNEAKRLYWSLEKIEKRKQQLEV